MANILKSLFGIKDHPVVDDSNHQINQRLSGETYKQWGHRMAGLNTGNNQSLKTHLQIVVQNIKKEQQANQALQEKNQQRISDQISKNQNDLDRQNSQLEIEEEKNNEIRKQINQTNIDIQNLNGKAKRTNRDARVNYIIGLFILVPLTIYLFVFYSSASFSAFFKNVNVNSTESLSSHIFDGNALGNAFGTSLMTGVFVLLITFIFLSLGYILHRYTEKKGGSKYFYIIGLILTTFIFDSLIAYRVSKITYDAKAAMTLGDVPEYSISLAFGQADFWMVICCGFLAYMIWGLLFGFVMESFKQLDLNKVEQNNLQQKLKQLNQDLQDSSDKISTLKTSITSLQSVISGLKSSMDKTAVYDISSMKLEINNFFSGWLQYLNAAGKSQVEIDDATAIVDNLLKTLQ